MSCPGYWELIATSAGIEWAAEAAVALGAADRTAVSGWPGTLLEARAELDALWQSLALKPDAGTRERLTRHAYDAARAAWRHTLSMALA